MKVFMVAGEESGDALGAGLIKSLKQIHGDAFECVGIGGLLMEDAGMESLLPMDQISIAGIWEVLPKIPRLLRISRAIVEEIEKRQPDVVVTVDFPDFNFQIAKKLKKRGVYKGKIVHYVAPSVWAWRPGRAKAIADFFDGIMCLFPMEPEYFSKHGLKAGFVGHPLVGSNIQEADGREFRKINEIADDEVTLGLFLGSREAEFHVIAPLMKKAAEYVIEMDKKHKIHVIVPSLPNLEFEVRNALKGFSAPADISVSPSVKWQAFKACDLAIAVSGTVALELACAGVPHVIMYKVNPLTALIVKVLAKVKYAHLANILLDKPVVPEFLQGKCRPELVATEILKMIADKSLGEKQKEEFSGLHALLGGNDPKQPSLRAAEFVTSVAGSSADDSSIES